MAKVSNGNLRLALCQCAPCSIGDQHGLPYRPTPVENGAMNDPGNPLTPGTLYVVATPLGNFDDISHRALAVLQGADCILAEDTRSTRRLLDHWRITPRQLQACHEYNERDSLDAHLAALGRGATLALVADAGTPTISDPGFPLVRAARLAGLAVSPVPGPSAVVAALSVLGLPTDRFWFEGFLPPKSTARRSRLSALVDLGGTLVFYEAPHRVEATMADLIAVFGPEREAGLARELTKTFETVRLGTLDTLAGYLAADSNHRRGEFVLLVRADADPEARRIAQAERLLARLLKHLRPREAAELAAELTGASGNAVYRLALQINAAQDESRDEA